MIPPKASRLIALLPALTCGSPTWHSIALTSRAVTLPQGAKWQIEIHDPIDFSKTGPIQPADAQVWDLDLWQAIDSDSSGKTAIQKLRERNGASTLVICYFNAGGVQESDEDYASFNGYKYGAIGDWEGESYVDITAPKVVELMLARVQKGLDAGCDGFDPDNVDAYSENLVSKADGKTKLDEAAYIAFLGKLATPIHAAGKVLGQKNAAELTAGLLKNNITDFAVLEDCLEDSFCDVFETNYAENGKAVLQIEYPKSVQPTSDGDDVVCPSVNASDADYKTVCGSPIKGFSTVIKQDGNGCGLNGFVEYCDGTGYVVTPMTQE
ncbi:glycoside hydrolase superfamily [Xylariales sp. AK1849]|nr:glycoside hydrolase superfamily [Xylariales sp. AK1849]